MNTPILFLIFNRFDTANQVFDEIKRQKPKKLYVAADGPRKNRAGEKEECERVRSIINGIDWECDVKTLFQEENLGCGKAISTAITWFFANEEEGIILEDDCLPHPDFFGYCQQLLEKYRDTPEVMFIGGVNYQDGQIRNDASYYFSAFSHVWGWASWRRVWDHYKFDVNNIVDFDSVIKYYFKRKDTLRYLKILFSNMRRNKIDTWDYQLTFSIWENKGLSIIPNQNLISNIGFGEMGTHTQDSNDKNSNRRRYPILPLTHPSSISIDVLADNYFIDNLDYKMKASKYYKNILGYYRIKEWFKI